MRRQAPAPTHTRTPVDAILVARCGAGDDDAFTAIVERHRPGVERACARRLPPALIDDAVQQTFVQAWLALRAGAQVRELGAWLSAIARNAGVDTLRAARLDHDVLPETLAGDGDPGDELERRRALRATLAGLAALPERQRAALVAVALDDRDHDEVARDLGLSDNALRQLLFRARTRLRAAAAALAPWPLVHWLMMGRAEAACLGASAGGAPTAAAGAGALAAKGLAVVVLAGSVAGGSAVIASEHSSPPRRAQTPTLPTAPRDRSVGVLTDVRRATVAAPRPEVRERARARTGASAGAVDPRAGRVASPSVEPPATPPASATDVPDARAPVSPPREREAPPEQEHSASEPAEDRREEDRESEPEHKSRPTPEREDEDEDVPAVTVAEGDQSLAQPGRDMDIRSIDP